MNVPGVHSDRGTGSSSSTRLSTDMSHVCGCYCTSSIYISHEHLHVTGTFRARPHSSSHRRHTSQSSRTQFFELLRFLTPRTQRVTADARPCPRLGTKRNVRVYLTRYRLNSTQRGLHVFSSGRDSTRRPLLLVLLCRGAQGQAGRLVRRLAIRGSIAVQGFQASGA